MSTFNRAASIVLTAFVGLLCLGAASTEPSAGRTFDITALGAKGDGTTSCTAAIRAAIDAVHRAGGGTVHVPAGKFLTGPIDFVDNMTLDIDKGGTLLFTANKSDYPIVHSRWEGVMTNGPRPLLWADGVKNIAITGQGTIDGQGSAWWGIAKSEWVGHGSAAVGAHENHPDADLGQIPATQPNKLPPGGGLRPPLCQIKDCSGIRIEGVTFTQSPFWTLHLLFSDNIQMDGARMVNPAKSPNTDACDIDSCVHVTIDNCFADVGDDAFCLKSGRDADGLKVNRPTQDVTVAHCSIVHAHGGVVIGSETSGGISHVRFIDDHCDSTQVGLRIKSMRGRGGIVQDVTVSNITMKDVGTALLLTSNYGKTSPAPVSVTTPILRDIHIDHVTASGAGIGLTLDGLEEMPISNISFTDVTISDKKAGSCEYGKDITFNRFTILSSASTELTLSKMENVTKTNYVDKGK